MSSAAPVLELTDLRRTFQQGSSTIQVLRGVSFVIAPGEVVALSGPSGAGKSTLLQLAGLLEQPDGGDIRLDGQSCAAMSDNQRTRTRREKLGFVYQFHHLLPEFSARENVMLPQMLGGDGKSEVRQEADALLDRLGVGERKHHRPAQMSGGEQQRVAIARAIATRPRILLADEPTGNLDSGTSEKVIATLFEATKSAGAALVLVTHDADLAERCERVLTIEDGRIVGDRKTEAGAA